MTEKAMKERKSRQPKTTADLLAAIEKKKQELAELEAKVHGTSLNELVKKHGADKAFHKIKEEAGNVSDLLILRAIGAVVGIKRLSVTQSPAVARKRKANSEV